MRFTFCALLVAGCIFALGYVPARNYDSPGGFTGLICGLSLALLLMLPGYFFMRWALGKSQKTFMVIFGAGFIIRLILLVLFFILYILLVAEGNLSFALAFGVCYFLLIGVEIFFFKNNLTQGVPSLVQDLNAQECPPSDASVRKGE